MTGKKMTVRYGLLTVLLISLSLASTSNAWAYSPPKVATPELSYWYIDWYSGGVVFALKCDTSGADIRYTWEPGYGVALTPRSSSQLYDGPLLATCIGQLKAKGFKNLCYSSDVLVLYIR